MSAPDCKVLRPEIVFEFLRLHICLQRLKKYQGGRALFLFNCKERSEKQMKAFASSL